MKKLFAVIAVAIMLITFSGCALYGNDRSNTAYIQAEQTETEYIIDISQFTYVNKTLYIDKATGAVRVETGDVKQPEDYTVPDCVVLVGNDFPRYEPSYNDGYEGLLEILFDRYKGNGVEYIQFYAVEYGKTAFGFCNLYSSATGFLSGGGQIDAAKIVAGVYFSYDAEAAKFTEIERLEKCNIIAANTSGVIYFKNRKYYSKAAGGWEKYICDDVAYDTGMTAYSHTEFFFNADYCIIMMNRRYSNYNKDYLQLVVTDYNGNVALSEKITGI